MASLQRWQCTTDVFWWREPEGVMLYRWLRIMPVQSEMKYDISLLSSVTKQVRKEIGSQYFQGFPTKLPSANLLWMLLHFSQVSLLFIKNENRNLADKTLGSKSQGEETNWLIVYAEQKQQKQVTNIYRMALGIQHIACVSLWLNRSVSYWSKTDESLWVVVWIETGEM